MVTILSSNAFSEDNEYFCLNTWGESLGAITISGDADRNEYNSFSLDSTKVELKEGSSNLLYLYLNDIHKYTAEIEKFDNAGRSLILYIYQEDLDALRGNEISIYSCLLP